MRRLLLLVLGVSMLAVEGRVLELLVFCFPTAALEDVFVFAHGETVWLMEAFINR